MTVIFGANLAFMSLCLCARVEMCLAVYNGDNTRYSARELPIWLGFRYWLSSLPTVHPPLLDSMELVNMIPIDVC